MCERTLAISASRIRLPTYKKTLLYCDRWGKRSLGESESEEEEEEVSSSDGGGPALLRQLRAASPLRWGKRGGRITDEDKRAPLRWGKRVPSR